MKLRAALVHVFTASGMIAVMLAVDAVFEGNAHLALLWLGVAMLIDGIDGALARASHVGEHLPSIDGAVLDHVIDYVSYCFVPALMIYRFELVPEGSAIIVTSFLLMTSLYTFANKNLKTAENDFQGFPALWNIVVFYMVVFDTAPVVNALAVFVLGALVFAPIVVVHPIRVVAWRRVTVPVLVIWSLLIFAYLALGRDGLPAVAHIIFAAATAYFIILCLWRSVCARRKKEA